MTSPDRDRRDDRDRYPPRQQSAVRGDLLAAAIYRDILKVWRADAEDYRSLEQLADEACDEAAVMIRELRRRDPATCELLAHLQGIPADSLDRELGFDADGPHDPLRGRP